jgi:hypothetical protein
LPLRESRQPSNYLDVISQTGPRRFGSGLFDCRSRGGLENDEFRAHIRGMKIRPSILLSAALLAAAILLVFRNELHAHDPHLLNRPAETVTECGYWDSMAAGMSCR